MRFLLIFSIFFLLGISSILGADHSFTELKDFSEFSEVNLEKLASGEILAKRGAVMDFERGISVETCFVVEQPLETAQKLLINWDPSSHADLKLYVHHAIQLPVDDEDFKDLNLASDKSSLRWLVDKTLSTTTEKTDLQITMPDAASITHGVQTQGADKSSKADLASACWKNLLKLRTQQFQEKGFAGIHPYNVNGQIIHAHSEIQNLLKEEVGITSRFSSLLNETPLMADANKAWITPFYYWELFDVTGHGTLDLGAIYSKSIEKKYQIIDCQYYATGAYYISLTFYELWPVEIDGKSMTLIWRGDLLSAPSVAMSRGIDRMAYGGIMLQEVKKSVRHFQDDAKKTLK